MINLMPPEVRTAIGYARQNTRLRRSATALTVLVVSIVLALLGGFFLLKQTSNSLAKQLDTCTTQLSLQDVDKVMKQVVDITCKL